MTANAARGEIPVELAGQSLVLRPTFDALARIEGETGVGVYALTRRLEAALNGVAGELRATDVAAVLVAGSAGGNGRSRDEITTLIVEAGLVDAAAAAFSFLVRALAGGREKNLGAPAVG